MLSTKGYSKQIYEAWDVNIDLFSNDLRICINNMYGLSDVEEDDIASMAINLVRAKLDDKFRVQVKLLKLHLLNVNKS